MNVITIVHSRDVDRSIRAYRLVLCTLEYHSKVAPGCISARLFSTNEIRMQPPCRNLSRVGTSQTMSKLSLDLGVGEERGGLGFETVWSYVFRSLVPFSRDNHIKLD